MTLIIREVPASELRVGDRIRRNGLADVVRETRLSGGVVEFYFAYSGRVTLGASERVQLVKGTSS